MNLNELTLGIYVKLIQDFPIIIYDLPSHLEAFIPQGAIGQVIAISPATLAITIVFHLADGSNEIITINQNKLAGLVIIQKQLTQLPKIELGYKSTIQ